MDEFKKYDDIFIIFATNRIDLLDAALIRPGHIDKQVYIGNPNSKTRSEILDIHFFGKPHDKTINKELLIAITNGMSGAEIKNLINEAMLLAIRNDREFMCMKDI